MNRSPFLPVALPATLLWAACDTQPPTQPLALELFFDIWDGAHSGNEHFFWLPPMVKGPSFAGVFDGTLEPVVEICEWTGAGCVMPLLAEFSMTTGSGSETVRVAGDHYHVNWHTKRFDLDPNETYRIRVLVDGNELGFADVDVVNKGKELKTVDTENYIPLKIGRTLPIKFRIEEGFCGMQWAEMESGTTVDLRDVWGTSSSNVYAVGSGGTILRFNGTSWSVVTGGTTAHLAGVWGLSSSDVYVLGDLGTILHFDGMSWMSFPSGTTEFLLQAWGTSSDNIYAVGLNGTILHFDGVTWTGMSSPTSYRLMDVWGTSDTDVYAVGKYGTILKNDGISWSAMAGAHSRDLLRVWGTSDSDIYATGDGGTIERFDGTSWRMMSSGVSNHVEGLWGASSDDIYATHRGDILHHDGNDGGIWAVTPSGSTAGFRGIWGSSPCDIFAVGQSGTIMRRH